jgi:hypothetical protein
MKAMTSNALLAVSSLSVFLMLCCALASYADLYMEHHEARVRRASWLRSGWFFYSNAALCLSSVAASLCAS